MIAKLVNMAIYSRYRVLLYSAIAILFLLAAASSWKSFSVKREFLLRPTGDELLSESHDDNLYGIMFDAGSTGTRIHVFTFEKLSGGELRLDKEYFQEKKPGLSSYADNPEEAAETVQFLLQHARREVLHQKWPQTPVALKATAGLRLLPENSANRLLEEVKKVFENSPFKTSGDDFVSIMDGVDEGIYAWITVNFLLEKLSAVLDETVGIVDLGGGSCQITFVPQVQETIDTAPDKFMRKLDLFHHSYNTYTHSYLGLGLMAARSEILKHGKAINGDSTRKVISTPCFVPGQSTSWSYGGVTYDIGSSGDFSFSSCLELFKPIVKSVDTQGEVNSRPFYIFSYFFDRALLTGLIGEKGGVLTIGDYMRVAQEQGCVDSKQSQDFPFLCMDLSYIIALLRDGFGFDEEKQLTLKKKIKDMEVSWALGATLHMFDKGNKST